MRLDNYCLKLFFSCLIFILSAFSFGFAKASNNQMEFSQKDFEKSITLRVKDKDISVSPTEWHKWVIAKNGLIIDSQYVSEIEPSNPCANDLLCYWLNLATNGKHVKRSFALKVDQESLRQFISDLSRQVNHDPVDARFQVENGLVSVFSLSSPGLILDEEKSLIKIEDALFQNNLTSPLELSFNETKPQVDSNNVDNLGIRSLIGEGQSNFAGSPKNRIFNIKVATGRFNGVLISPNEEFSFVKTLGEVDADHGYLPELVIKKDKTEPEFGGGICQVSTTAFRAAVNSGLKITARKNHAYPVSYYNPQGFDSTVYIPRPDLRFINNTPGYILIQTKIEGTILTFDFYGTDDGRKINIIGPKILEKNSDGSMKTTLTQEVYDKSDTLIFSDVFNSSYDSPSKYPHPGEVLTQKPDSWSDAEWRKYKKEHSNS